MSNEEKHRTDWRFMRGWSDKELQDRLNMIREAPLNFPEAGPESQDGTNWRRYYSESVVAQESPGEVLKNGVFMKLWKSIGEYRFSDPDIVEGHFNPQDPIENRSILLEIKVLGLKYLCGVRVRGIKQDHLADRTVYGFRYDTLAGHMETGSEWFLLTKIHETGEIWFRISASWRPGVFPNWWSELGFELVGSRYQLAWHRLAYLRLRDIAGGELKLKPVPYGKSLVRTGPEVINSDLWKIHQKSPVEKVIQVGDKNDANWNDDTKDLP